MSRLPQYSDALIYPAHITSPWYSEELSLALVIPNFMYDLPSKNELQPGTFVVFYCSVSGVVSYKGAAPPDVMPKLLLM